MGHEIEVKELGFAQPRAVFVEEIIELSPLLRREDRLAHAKGGIVVTREQATGGGSDDPANFLESLMPVNVSKRLLLARKPARKVTPCCFAPGRHLDRFGKFPIRQKYGILPSVLEAMREVEIARALGQEGGMRHIQHFALGMFQLFQGQGGLAAARASDNHDGGGNAIDGFLEIVKGQRLVEEVYVGAIRVQVAQWLGFSDGLGKTAIGNFAFINLRPAQEARFVIVVILNDFKHQGADRVAMTNQ